MKTWKVKISINNDNTIIQLQDASRYFDGYLKIKRRYFNSLLTVVEDSPNYQSGSGIEEIISPDDKLWTQNPWILILVKDKEKEKRFWFLIKREEDLSGILIGIGPKEFADYNYNNSEAKREIMRIFNYIIAYINKFECLIILPSYII